MRALRHIAATGWMVVAVGCATPTLDRARQDYHSGRFDEAARRLESKKTPERDRVLVMMERGMSRQAAGDFEGSSRDFIDAFTEIDRMTAISLTRDTGSMVINDQVQEFRGAPFERTLLHSFTAKNHLMLSNWENAAVEARRIIQSLAPEIKKDYPEDAYSRYMAGFCLSLIGDWSNAALQYRLAQQHLPHLLIDERTGVISPGTNQTTAARYADAGQGPRELVVFVLVGRSPRGEELLNPRYPLRAPGYAEIVVDGQTVGRSYALADTIDLAFTTKEKDAFKETAKTISRIAAKEVIAYQIDKENELLGALFRIIMIGVLEQPDVRRWETLPRSLQVARVPLPETPETIEVLFRTGSAANRRLTLPSELPRNGRTSIYVVRDNQPVL
ncbi:MAG TPA: hypothetical protein PKE26_08200 [Kiritimatiellia bacterium]|nr:hypothetical protein [Kiritimatiellia bacterium]HMO99075.1 hypothetical protein [Kiritimatiellia bacterium]HMP97140.1 hypothetical protein [Kiritimatiellia bacterium]